MSSHGSTKNKTISVYVLRLQGDKYYVGQSKHPKQRIKEHFDGKGSSWTRLHKPIEVVHVIETKFTHWRAALEVETALTLELMRSHGWQNVRGGLFSSSQLACAPTFLIDPITSKAISNNSFRPTPLRGVD